MTYLRTDEELRKNNKRNISCFIDGRKCDGIIFVDYTHDEDVYILHNSRKHQGAWCRGALSREDIPYRHSWYVSSRRKGYRYEDNSQFVSKILVLDTVIGEL